MKTFSENLLTHNIFLDLNASSKIQALAKISDLLEQQHQIRHGLIYESLYEREQLGSTALGDGVAIPHAQIKGLRHTIAAFVRLDFPIDFDAPDGKPVSEIFILLVPRNTTIQHLRMLAEIAEMMCDCRFREELVSAIEPQNVQRLFSNYDHKISP